MTDMTEMVERVAKAIGMTAGKEHFIVDSFTEDDSGRMVAHYNAKTARVLARAAIEAMREPTKEMKRVGSNVTWWNSQDGEDWEESASQYDAGKIYGAMIDAALTTTEER